MENVNWFAMIVATLIPTVTGIIWYSPPLFQKPLLETLRLKPDDMKKGNLGLIYGAGYVTAFLIAIFLNSFINNSGGTEMVSIGAGALKGLFASATLAVPVLISSTLFQRIGIKNALINSGYWLITITIMGAVIGGWR